MRGLSYKEAFKKTNIYEVVDNMVIVDIDNKED